MDQAGVARLIASKGQPATLRVVASTRANTGGAVTQTTTDTATFFAKLLDVTTSADGEPARKIVGLLATQPHLGDTLVLGMVSYTVTAVEAHDRAGVTLAWEVTLG